MTPQVISLSALGSTAWIPVDYIQNPYNINIAIVLSNTPNLTCKVEYTLDDIFNPAITPTAFTHATLTGLTTNSTGNITSPVRAIRLTVTAWTSGTATMTALQGAVNSSLVSLGQTLSSAPSKTTPVSADTFALGDSEASGTLKKLSWDNLTTTLRTGGLIDAATAIIPNIRLNAVDTISDVLVDQATLITSAYSYSSRIGVQSKPSGAAGSNSDPAIGVDTERGLPWSIDSAYPNNGIAHVSCVYGGYDHVCNQEAGTVIGGGHNFLQYNPGGHSVIIGGSNHRNAGARSLIVGGVNNTINASSSYSAAVAGSGASLSTDWAITLGGENSVIKSGASGAAILAGRGNTIGTNSYYAAILSSQNGTVQDSHGYTIISGRGPKSESSGSFTMGVKPLVYNGDCQISTVGFGLRTTNATITSMVTSDGSWNLGSIACALVVNGQVVGVDEATGAMCAYTVSVVLRWDGSTTSSIADSGGVSVASRPFVVIRDDIGVGAVPVIAADTGILRIRVTGKAATNIKWCGRMDVCAVRV